MLSAVGSIALSGGGGIARTVALRVVFVPVLNYAWVAAVACPVCAVGVVAIGVGYYAYKQGYFNGIFNSASGDDGDKEKEKAGAEAALGANSTSPQTPPPDDDDGSNGRTDHGEKRASEAKTDPNRSVGDANRVIRDGRKLVDNDTGHNVYVSGDRVVITNENREIVSQFKNTRANTAARIESGRWTPVE